MSRPVSEEEMNKYVEETAAKMKAAVDRAIAVGKKTIEAEPHVRPLLNAFYAAGTKHIADPTKLTDREAITLFLATVLLHKSASVTLQSMGFHNTELNGLCKYALERSLVSSPEESIAQWDRAKATNEGPLQNAVSDFVEEDEKTEPGFDGPVTSGL